MIDRMFEAAFEGYIEAVKNCKEWQGFGDIITSVNSLRRFMMNCYLSHGIPIEFGIGVLTRERSKWRVSYGIECIKLKKALLVGVLKMYNKTCISYECVTLS